VLCEDDFHAQLVPKLGNQLTKFLGSYLKQPSHDIINLFYPHLRINFVRAIEYLQ